MGCAGSDSQPVAQATSPPSTQQTTPTQTQTPQTPTQTTPPPSTTPPPVVTPPPAVTEPPPPAEPKPMLTLQFMGQLSAPDATVHGTFTYETTQGPSATNIQHLKPNVGYVIKEWNIVVDGSSLTIPSTTVYVNDQPSNSAEFCEGYCLATAPAGWQLIKLIFKNASGNVLELVFNLQVDGGDPTPDINPPGSVKEWGAFLSFGSDYIQPCGVLGCLVLVQSGSLSVPQEAKAPEN